MTVLQFSLNDVLILAGVVVLLMLAIVLYHLIFVAISLKRIARRMDSLTEDVEAIILKPIGAIDYVLDWFIAGVESIATKKKHKGKKVEVEEE